MTGGAERLERALLIGASRSPIPALPGLEPFLGRSAGRSSLDERGEAEVLLDALALAHARALGGSELGAREGQLLEEAPSEARPDAPAPAAALLSTLLRDRRRQGLLREWLARCHDGGFVLPPAALPAALELAFEDGELRELILPLLGERGRWLARLRPRWAFAAGAEDGGDALEGIFHGAGDAQIRRSAFLGLSAADRERARRALDRAWDGLGAREKVMFLDSLGLSPDDAPLLERARQDGAKTVRAVATDLLARLPGSALLLRMESRLQDILQIRRGAFLVDVPRHLDPEVEADGVIRDPPSAPHGKRHAWVEQMLAMVPPDRWSVWFEAPPEALLVAVDRSSTSTGLRLALSAAAVRHQDARWARLLLDRPGPAEMALARLLPAADRERHVASALTAAATPERLSAVLGRLVELPPPMSARLMGVALGAMTRLARSRVHGPPAFGALRHVALDAELDSAQGEGLDAALRRFVDGLPPGSPWRDAAEDALALAGHRRRIASAFRSESVP